MSKKNLIVGMTGASGAIFGVRVLEALRDTDVTTHLVVSKWAQQTLEHETVAQTARSERPSRRVLCTGRDGSQSFFGVVYNRRHGDRTLLS